MNFSALDPRPVAVAEADRQVDLVALEIDELERKRARSR
jgi:hypothetical protein